MKNTLRVSAVAWVVCMVFSLAGPSDARTGQDAGTALDPDLGSYRPIRSLEGKLTSVGSDTLHPLISSWADRFRGYYPKVAIEIEAKGSNTAPPALIDAKAQLCPMSRALNAKEIEAFDAKYGYKPRHIRAAVDAICVFVHKDNPLKSMTLEQVDAVFSSSRRRGGKEVRTWGDLGLSGEWADRPVHLAGRNALSGTRQFFKDHALKGGDFRADLKEHEGSAQVVAEIAKDPAAIGYSGVGYAASDVRALALSLTDRDAPQGPTAASAYAGEYPLSRILFVYFNQSPDRPADPAVREFLRMICSKEGQELVQKAGYFPMPAAVAKAELAKAN
jgi:phosphate transport system substrate-binding protein